jgi:hypothetical protein
VNLLSFENLTRFLTTKLAKLTGTETKMPFERFAERGMSVITGSQRDFGNIYRAHPQLLPGPFHADTAYILGDRLTRAGGKDAMQVRHRKTGDFRQCLPVERLVDVFADVPLYNRDAFVMVLMSLCISHHIRIIAYQNARSLFQMYHLCAVGVKSNGSRNIACFYLFIRGFGRVPDGVWLLWFT